jgi:hypothetical protein
VSLSSACCNAQLRVLPDLQCQTELWHQQTKGGEDSKGKPRPRHFNSRNRPGSDITRNLTGGRYWKLANKERGGYIYKQVVPPNLWAIFSGFCPGCRRRCLPLIQQVRMGGSWSEVKIGDVLEVSVDVLDATRLHSTRCPCSPSIESN